jgi:transposase
MDVFVEALDLVELGFDGAQPMATGRPGYRPAVLLKLYIYGYLQPRAVQLAAISR